MMNYATVFATVQVLTGDDIHVCLIISCSRPPTQSAVERSPVDK